VETKKKAGSHLPPGGRYAALATSRSFFFHPFSLTFSYLNKMKIIAAALCLLAGGASAFSPQGFVSRKSGLVVPPSAQDDSNSPLLTPNMVAGGAERSYGQEYYEGE
jgi:hypothetical protein